MLQWLNILLPCDMTFSQWKNTLISAFVHILSLNFELEVTFIRMNEDIVVDGEGSNSAYLNPLFDLYNNTYLVHINIFSSFVMRTKCI